MPELRRSCPPPTGYLIGSGGIIGGGTAIGRGGIGGIGGIAGGFGSSGGFGSAGGAGRLGGWIAGCPWPAPVFGCGSRVGAIVGAGCGAMRCDLARVAVWAEVRACGRFLGDADLPALGECEMTGTGRAGCVGAWWRRAGLATATAPAVIAPAASRATAFRVTSAPIAAPPTAA